MVEKRQVPFNAELGGELCSVKGPTLAVNEAMYKVWGDVVNTVRQERGVAVADCGLLHAYFTELVDAILMGDSVESRALKAKELLDGRFSAYAK